MHLQICFIRSSGMLRNLALYSLPTFRYKVSIASSITKQYKNSSFLAFLDLCVHDDLVHSTLKTVILSQHNFDES